LTEDQKKYSKYTLIVTFLVGLITAGATLFVHFDSKSIATSNAQQVATNRGYHADVIEDARVVVDSIVIWGGESTGVDLGYLAQVAGFYEKHQDLFKSQHALYSKELAEWRLYFASRRSENRTIYKSDIEPLVGLVKSGKDHLQSIIKKWEEKHNNQ
tara:strand:+ start:355 stop:825 length:471 start_codon:yes stop_codon:yes gene_type:complete